jgi:hypothetical protein
MEVICVSYQEGIRLVPARRRRVLYERCGAHWYWTLISNAAPGPAGELRVLDAALAREDRILRPLRLLLRARIRWHLRTADDPSPKDEGQRLAWSSRSRLIHDTAAYDRDAYPPDEVEITLVSRRLGWSGER